MTTSERFERDVPVLLEELYLGPVPSYRDDILRRTAATRQRPGWTFIERWLPVSAITGRLTAAPRVPWRAVALAALLLLAFAAAAIYIGSQQRHVPPPFGPAANGQIPFVRNGDIYLGDPVTGKTQLLVGDSGDDAVPQFSPDGTKLAFIRDVPVEGETTPRTDIFVANADGSDRRAITPEPFRDVAWFSWAPDSRRLAIVHAVNTTTQLDLFATDGSGAFERIDGAAGADYIQYRPPDGREILFRRFDGARNVLFSLDVTGGEARRLAGALDASSNDLDLNGAVYSADGSRIFYQRADPSQGSHTCCKLWVMDADGGNQHEFVPNSEVSWDGTPAVSPDGTWVAFWRRPATDAPQPMSVVRADGTGPVLEVGPPLAGTGYWIWSPDSSKLLLWDNDGGTGKAVLVDPQGGPWTEVPWQSDADLDWQRTAP